MSMRVSNRDNFYSEHLSDSERAFYYKCVDSLSKGEYSITGSLRVDAEDLNSVMERISTAVIIGCPELFHLDQHIQIQAVGGKVTLTFRNKYEGQDLDEMSDRLEAEIDRICKKILTYKTDYDRIVRLNQYLCIRVKPELSMSSAYSDAYAALINKEARCEGYSKAAKLILDRIGIESMIVMGEADNNQRTMDHTWNIVYCDGKPYHFDFTWDAGLNSGEIPGMAYLFLSDESCLLDHRTQYPIPRCEDDSKEMWVATNGVVNYVAEISRAKVLPVRKGHVAFLRFARPQDETEIRRNAANWARYDLGGKNLSRYQYTTYLPLLRLLLVYFTDE